MYANFKIDYLLKDVLKPEKKRSKTEITPTSKKMAIELIGALDYTLKEAVDVHDIEHAILILDILDEELKKLMR